MRELTHFAVAILTSRVPRKRSLRRRICSGLLAPAAVAMLLSPLGCKKPSPTSSQSSAASGGAAGPAKSPEGAGGSTTEPPGGPGISGTSPTELSENPAAVYNAAIAPAQLELYKVKLRDPASDIPKEAKPDQSGWLSYRGENTYRVENDKVVALRVSDPAVLAKLGINSEEDLFNRFKKADETIQASDAAPEAEFVYKDRWLEVWWNRKANKVTAIQVNAPG